MKLKLLWLMAQARMRAWKMRRREPDPGHVRRVAFLKLQKTAGTTFAASILFPYCVRHGLSYMFPWKLPGSLITRANLAQAHSRDGTFHMLFRHFPDFPKEREWLDKTLGGAIYLTIVRRPLPRAVSVYNHVIHWGGYSKSFQEFVESGDYRPNHQSALLGYRGQPNYLAQVVDVVGLSERFDESMILFRRALDLRLSDVLYVKQRATEQFGGSRIFKVSDVDEATRSRLEQIDALDTQLYAEAEKFFDRQRLALSCDGADDELRLFREALSDRRHPLWRERGAFKVGYAEGDEWGELTEDGEYRQLTGIPA